MFLYDCQPRIFCSVKCRSKNKEWRNAHAASIKGKPTWNKGKKGLQKNHNISGLNSVKGISWNKGKTGLQVAWNKGIKMPENSGENNPNWKGGITTENNAIRSSLEYREWRISVFKRDNYTCQHCFKRGNGVLHADHIKPFASYPELRLDLDNGRTLCIECHKKTPTYSARKKEKQYA